MSIHRLFKSQFSLRGNAREVAFLLVILSLSGCGADEPVNNPVGCTSGGKPDDTIPIFSDYYPMTLGSRWVYRNPDGSEWSREVTEIRKFGANLYHSISYDSPVQVSQLDSLRSPVYAAYLYRLDRRINRNDINDTVWEIIVESGGESQNWGLGMSCNNLAGRKPVCVSRKDKLTPAILTYLYRSNTGVVWHSKLTLLRFPIVPGDTYNALNLRLRGRDEGPFYIHAFAAEGVILGKISEGQELVETSASAFEDCLKIQYEANQSSYKTLEFRDVGAAAMFAPGAYLEAVESEIREELTDLLTHIMPKLGLESV